MRNINDTTGECAIRGNSFEELFKSMAIARGFTVRNASSNEDRFDHFDFQLSNFNVNPIIPHTRYECKAMKKLRRQDAKPQDEWIMIEFKGISGHKGWLYGLADYLAFEQSADVIIVPRLSLVKLAEKLISQNKWVNNSADAKYCCYARNDRPEEKVGMIMNADILDLPDAEIWDK